MEQRENNSGGWCVRVQPKENCEVSNIRSVKSGLFQFSTRCESRCGYSESSGIGEVNCNNQTQWNSTNYSAHGCSLRKDRCEIDI
jgi:hypothetical protein